MNPVESETQKDLRAAALTARELGPEYENDVMDGFLHRLDQRLEAQIAVRVRHELDAGRQDGRAGRPSGRQRGSERSNAFQYFSLAIAVPLSAIGANLGHLPGLVVAWAGIVAVNFVQLRSRRDQEQRAARPRPRRDEWD